MGGEVAKETLKDAMKWDLWNPWALYYELNSTHPLIAKRLIALSDQAEVRGKEPYIRFREKRPESYWDEFSLDAVVSILPLLVLLPCLILFFLSRDVRFLPWTMIMVGIAYLVRVTFSYKFSAFPEMSVSALLKKVKVSGVRPIPCTLRGTIIGRGVPGLIWSEDFVFQDETGILFLDYRQPLAIWNFLFGLLRAKHYVGREARIRGWYRRSPVPYVELKTLETAGSVSECYVFYVKVFWGVLFTLLGIVLLFWF
jgi:heat shock protein HtpX